MNEIIDLRSDTVTEPTDEMRHAMAEAAVGDDVYEEDPTVAALQEECADMLGHEAALFVPTGTMGNQIAIHLLTRPGDEVLIEGSGHSYDWELSGMAVISGVQPRVLRGDRGIFDPADVEVAIAERPAIRSRVSLLIAENTHNMAGGKVWPRETTEEIQRLCRQRGVALHLDGARLFNAAVASRFRVAQLAAGFDTVMVSLSKGLSAPMGSLLAGSADLMREARRVRKLLGGGMRQVGVVAAAGRVALRTMVDRLAEDHANARRLAEGLTGIEGVKLAFGHVDTNIVVLDLSDGAVGAARFVAQLAQRGVACLRTGPGSVRMVTHRGISGEDVEHAIEAARAVFAAD
jgi:threonine aldolase